MNKNKSIFHCSCAPIGKGGSCFDHDFMHEDEIPAAEDGCVCMIKNPVMISLDDLVSGCAE